MDKHLHGYFLNHFSFRISVKGKKPHLVGPPNRRNQSQENIPTPDSVDSRGEFDLIHNSNQADADFSIYNRSSTTTARPIFQINDSDFGKLSNIPLIPLSLYQLKKWLFGYVKVLKMTELVQNVINIGHWQLTASQFALYDYRFVFPIDLTSYQLFWIVTSAPSWRPSNSIRRPPPTRSPVVGLPTMRPNARPVPQTGGVDSEPKVSRCVWAIVNCCTGESKKVRYNCFEEFGCHGAFWDINPCADEGVKQGALTKVLDAFQNQWALNWSTDLLRLSQTQA